MDNQWSVIEKLLKKENSFKEGIFLLIQWRDNMFKAWHKELKDLPKDNYAKMPFFNHSGYKSKTIAYSLYHVFRIEDIVLHSLIKEENDILETKDYQTKLNVTSITTGNELKSEDIGLFSKSIHVDELWKYMNDVYSATNEYLSRITFNELKRKFTENDIARINALHVVDTTEAWLIDYWCSKNILGLMGMPFSRHWLMHFKASLKIKNKIFNIK